MGYKITPIVWSVKSKDSVMFHVNNDDYFGSIATILNLIKEDIKNNKVKNSIELQNILDNLEKDLVFLQQNYQINPKEKAKKSIPKGREINQ